MSNFNIKGVDISNNNSISDLSTLKNNGVKYVYLKATEGATFKDNKSIDRYSKCHDLGLKVGFYHFLVNTSKPEAQAENFYNYIKDKVNDLIPMLDVEKDWNGMSSATIAFINHFNEISGGMKLGIYTYSGFLDNFTGAAQQIMKDMPCWIANYRNDYEGVNTGFFKCIVGWQYSENGSIGTFTGDCNVFNEGCLLNTGAWKQNDKGWWYEYKDGTYPVSQWKHIDNDWYYFDDKGYAYQNRWLKSNGKWYYFKDNCKMAHGETLSYPFKADGSLIE